MYNLDEFFKSSKISLGGEKGETVLTVEETICTNTQTCGVLRIAWSTEEAQEACGR